MIPSQIGMTVNLHREELMTLLRQISLFAAETNQSVRFTFGEGELKLTANAMEVGEGKVSMPVNYSGQKLEIAFNPDFFLGICRHIKNETFSIGLTDSWNPGLISDVNPAKNESENEEELKSLFVLMPMRLNED